MPFQPFVILLIILLLSACAVSPKKPEIEVSSEPAPTVPSREAVYITNETKNCPMKIELHLGGEPVLLPSGYVRLVGVVAAEKPEALLEIGGRGLAAEEGEIIGGYKVMKIGENELTLKKDANT